MDWTRFVQRIPIAAEKAAIYKLIATREGMEYWFLRKSEFTKPDGTLRADAEFVQTGDSYSWLWHGWSDEMEEKGTILDCNGTDSVQFTFADPCKVRITIIQEHGQNVVELVQENIPTDDETKMKYYVGCSNGWTFYLANMKSLLEGGPDLRNRDVQIRQVVNS